MVKMIVLVLWCLLSCVSGGTMLDKLYPSMPDEESDVSPGEDDSLISFINMAIIDHVQDMLSEMSQDSETPEMSGKMGFGKFYCFGKVKEKYRSCNKKCNKLSKTERTACKLMNFANKLVACFSGSMECDERWTGTVTSKVGECNSNCNCGIPNERHQKIYGGSEVEYEVKYPWHVGILNTKKGKTAYCGGTIVGDKYVITAAHCLQLQDIDDKDFSVRIGDHIQTTVDDIEEITKTIPVEKIHYHPENNKNTYVYDIALLELSQTITFTNEFGIRPICLPCLEDTDDYEGKSAITLGWGKTKHDSFEIPETLKQAEVTILDKDCENKLGEVFKPDMAVCSVSNSNKGVSCWADNGGSLFVNEGNKTNERHVLVGITLFPSCRETIPVIYTRVKCAIKWIQKLVLVTTCASEEKEKKKKKNIT